ncbi:MAG: flavin reductase [Propioniciclava sp.]|uniref:flavin reductase n=1 Tax=Propioniciclava sp. TaxID=2038686 RepID=UPI0039E2BB28
MSIHREHPFAVPPSARDAARRLRGRLAAPVTLWASGRGAGRAGLTVSSTLVVPGEPPRVLGLVDPDTDLADLLVLDARFVVAVLTPAQRRLVEVFAGLGPAPGGPFAAAEFLDTDWGPRPAASGTWAGARVTDVRPMGWSVEVSGVLEHIEVADEAGLIQLRGRLREP